MRIKAKLLQATCKPYRFYRIETHIAVYNSIERPFRVKQIISRGKSYV